MACSCSCSCLCTTSAGVTVVTIIYYFVRIISLQLDTANNQIDCTFETNGNAENITVIWEKNGETIGESNTTFYQDFQLSINSTETYIASLTATQRESLNGTFSCIIELNHAGISEQDTITLTAPDPPRNLQVIENTSLDLTLTWEPPLIDDSNGNYIVSYRIMYGSISINVSENTRSYLIHDLEPNTNYEFFVFAKTVVEGQPSGLQWKTNEAAPSPPTITRAVNTGSTSILIEWTPPSSPNGIIRGYLITFTQISGISNSTLLTQNITSGTMEFELTGLEFFTTYTISIQAQTVEIGNSSNSVNVTTDEDAPSAPVDIRAFNTTSTSLRVEWIPPANPNGIIRGYRISYYKALSSPLAVMIQDVGGNETSYELTGLEVFTTYSITIQGRTIQLGEVSSIVNATTDEDAPSPPISVRIFNSSSTSLVVEWEIPIMPNGIIQSYLIVYFPIAVSNGTMSQEVAGSETRYELTNLEIYTNYSITVQARTIRLGQASSPVIVTTDEDAPSEPLDIRGFNTSSTSLHVEWNPPANPNGIIRAYRISYYKTSSSDDPLAVVTEYVAGSETSYELTGLEIYTTYSIFVQGRTIEWGNSSVTVNITTEEDAPSPPILIGAFNTSSTSVRVEWNPPTNPNGIIRGYLISYYQTSSSQSIITQEIPGSMTSYELTGLQIFTTYTISIQGRTIRLGESSISVNVTTHEDAPSEPLHVRVFNTSSSSLRVEWNIPETLNGIIRGYRISYYITTNNEEPLTQDVAGNETSFELTALEIFTTYSVFVQGQTILLGNASVTVNATTEEDAPSPPTMVNAFNTSSRSLRVEWSSPDTPNGIIRGYQISYIETSNSDSTRVAVMTQDVAGNETSYELTDLEIFTTYSIFVQGRTIVWGDSSIIMNVTTQEDAPSPPTIVRAFNTTSTSLRVEWIPPVNPNGNIRGYQISYYTALITDESPAIMTHVVAGNETSYELTGLEIFTTYSIFLTGRTIVFGEVSTTVNVTTDEDVPTPPINVTATDLNSTTIRISWNQPSSPNGIVVQYTLYFRQKLTTFQGWDTVSVLLESISPLLSSYTYELTGLLEFTQYQVAVTSSTRVGESNMSHPVIVTTDPESSDPPTAVTALPIDSSTIHISWGFPNVSRGRIQGYVVTVNAVNQDNVPVVRHNITLSTINDMRNQTAEFDTLDVFTCYWFEVAAYSFSQPGDAFQIHHGLNSQPVMGCTFDEDVWFQLRIKELGKLNCDTWVEEDISEKLKSVESYIASNVETQCKCGFVKKYIKSGAFRCFHSSKNSVTYRGVLNGFGNTSSDDLIEMIEQWISRNVTIPIQTVLRPIDSTCTVRIASVDAEECSTATNNNRSPTAIIITVIIITIVSLVSLSVGVLLFIKLKVKKQIQVEVLSTSKPGVSLDINNGSELPPKLGYKEPMATQLPGMVLED